MKHRTPKIPPQTTHNYKKKRKTTHKPLQTQTGTNRTDNTHKRGTV